MCRKRVYEFSDQSVKGYQYPNSSIVYLLIECPDSKKHESELINLFTSKYKLKKFYGNEYFEGELESMKQDIISYVKTHYNVFRIVNNPFNIYRYTEDGLYVLPNDRAIKNITVETVNTVNTVNTDNLVIEDNNDDGDNGDNVAILDDKAVLSNASNNNGYKTCDNCGTEFAFPCHLERHLNSKRKCKSKDNQIKDYVCNHCSIVCSSKYNLSRHYKVCKIKLAQESKVIENNLPDNNTLTENINKSNIDIRNINNQDNNTLNVINNTLNVINKVLDKDNITNIDELLLGLVNCLQVISNNNQN
jgi:hypothetical protein